MKSVFAAVALLVAATEATPVFDNYNDSKQYCEYMAKNTGYSDPYTYQATYLWCMGPQIENCSTTKLNLRQ